MNIETKCNGNKFTYTKAEILYLQQKKHEFICEKEERKNM